MGALEILLVCILFIECYISGCLSYVCSRLLDDEYKPKKIEYIKEQNQEVEEPESKVNKGE